MKYDFLQVSAGKSHVAVVLESGEVYTWGNPDDGRLGRAFDEKREEEQKEDVTTDVSSASIEKNGSSSTRPLVLEGEVRLRKHCALT